MALGNSALCETDITGGSTSFAKIEVSCDHITESEHPVVMTGYLCTDSACSNCSDTVAYEGWSPWEDFTTMAGTTNNPDTCWSYNTVSIDAGAIWDSMVSTSSPSYVKYTTSPEILAAYNDVFIGNSCLVDYAKTEIEEGVHTEDDGVHTEGSPPSTADDHDQEGDGHDDGSNVKEDGGSSSACVWGLSMSISAVAGLGAAILSL